MTGGVEATFDWWVWESWTRGSSDVASIDVGRTDGSSRYKTEDYLSCPVGIPICVDGKYRCPDMLFLPVKPTLYNPKPLRCLYKPEGRSVAGSQHC